MLYNRLADDELERLIYVDPGNAAARAEMLRRVPDLLDQNDADLQEARDQAQQAYDENDKCNREKETAEEAAENAENAESELEDARAEITELKARIEELTNAEDLV